MERGGLGQRPEPGKGQPISRELLAFSRGVLAQQPEGLPAAVMGGLGAAGHPVLEALLWAVPLPDLSVSLPTFLSLFSPALATALASRGMCQGRQGSDPLPPPSFSSALAAAMGRMGEGSCLPAACLLPALVSRRPTGTFLRGWLLG